jgi:hypothetical protein
MGTAPPPFDPSRAGHTGGDCPDCKRPIIDPKLAGVTEDTVRFCPGTGLPGCISWTHKEDSGPGNPPPKTIFGFKPASVVKAGIAAGAVAGLIALLSGKRRK